MKKAYSIYLLFYGFTINGIAGLFNEGNTCYINATLQNLFAFPEFNNALAAMPRQDGGSLSIAQELHKLMVQHRAAAGSIQPTGFIDCIARNSLLGNLAVRAQQDAEEFFSALIDKLTDSDRSIGNLFTISLRTDVDCCWGSDEYREPLSHLTLPLTADPVPRLTDCLDDYFIQKITDRPCDGCPPDFVTIEKITPTRVSDILVIALQRRDEQQRKIMKGIIPAFSLRLDLEAGAAHYELSGAVLHRGESFASGHYVAVVQKVGHWYLCNDSVVTQLSVGQAQNMLAGTNRADGQPYLLFYRRTDHAARAPSPAPRPGFSSLQNLLQQTKQFIAGLYIRTIAL